MSKNYKDVRSMAHVLLSRTQEEGRRLTSEEIAVVVNRAIELIGCDDVDPAALVADLEETFETRIGTSRVLQGEEDRYEPWLSKRKVDIDWRFWNRYEEFLRREKGWAPATLDQLDIITDRILDLLTVPDREGPWDRRGMVVGHVQSGKTSNYIGLIAKAADAGYKLIVVLAGFHNSLRTQTQMRLEEGFLGHDRGAGLAGPQKPIGVGLIDPRPRADSITNRLSDFKRQVALNFAINPGDRPLLFVVKKNASVLRNLLGWVDWAANAKDSKGRRYVRDVPLLVIDDEADQGSIDTRRGAITETGVADPEHDPTILNGLIRELLHKFDQSAYVGYTATPFANILIHEGARTEEQGEDLFPRSFIVSLPTPTNHIGPAQIFGSPGGDGNDLKPLPIVRHIDDHAETLALDEREGWMPPKHRTGHVPLYQGAHEVPPSLRRAIHCFILTCAARIARGHGSAHNSMLIHVTRFTAVQAHVAAQVRTEIVHFQRSLRYGDGRAPSGLINDLRELWYSDFEPTSDAVADLRPGARAVRQTWEDVELHLERACVSIQVREINGEAAEVLDYENHAANGLNVIAVGGDKLSRGLTLEGLSVSYFLRASKMYDTLMQMGRWFGYRPGYLDLCRLYTTADLAEWFSYITQAAEELHEDFGRMEASGGTPRDFGHRVRSHPAMLVTSQVKMRSGTVIDLSFEGAISETINFWRTRDRLEANWLAAKRLVERAEAAGRTGRPLQTGGPVRIWDMGPDLIVDFLASYQEHTASRKVKTKLLIDYINAENLEGRLTDWTVLVASGSSKETETLGAATINLVERQWYLTAGSDAEREEEKRILKHQGHYRIRRLVSPADEMVDLTEAQRDAALELTRKSAIADDRDASSIDRPGGREIRQVRSPGKGLMILYPLDGTGSEKIEANTRDIPVLGFAISFPFVRGGTASTVKYVVNNVYYDQEFSVADFDNE
jgi:hypothetical protein